MTRSRETLVRIAHTAALREAASEYERRVTAFFDDALSELSPVYSGLSPG
jgi:hypothetical protein